MKLYSPFPAVSADTIMSLFLKPYALASSKLLCLQPCKKGQRPHVATRRKHTCHYVYSVRAGGLAGCKN